MNQDFCLKDLQLVFVYLQMNGNLQPSLNANDTIFLSNFISKAYPSSHNETSATAWRQQNADWWSDAKKTNQNNSTSAKSTTPINQAKHLDDEAAGKLSYSDLHCIITAALERGYKQQQAYRALANNYASLVCSFQMTIKPDTKSIASSIFKQNKHVHLEQDKENTVSLTEMQTAIHKLQPQDLEFPVPEKTTSSNIGNDGPRKDMIEDRSGTTFHSCPNNIYHKLFETIHQV